MPLLAATLGLTQPEHGYVLAVGLATAFVNVWHGLNVGRARKAAKISYPTAYASTEEANKNPAAMKFNCAQRAHGNFSEVLPTFLILLVTAGIRFPTYAALSGLVFLAGRIVYTLGYSTGDPAQRAKGNFSYLGVFALLGLGITNVYKTVSGQ